MTGWRSTKAMHRAHSGTCRLQTLGWPRSYMCSAIHSCLLQQCKHKQHRSVGLFHTTHCMPLFQHAQQMPLLLLPAALSGGCCCCACRSPWSTKRLWWWPSAAALIGERPTSASTCEISTEKQFRTAAQALRIRLCVLKARETKQRAAPVLCGLAGPALGPATLW